MCPIFSYLFKKFNKNQVAISTIVLAYYTLFQCYRMTYQWNNGREYIEEFQQACVSVNLNVIENYDQTFTNLLLATGYFTVGCFDEALDITTRIQASTPKITGELMSMSGIISFICLSDVDSVLQQGVTLELPYALSECGDPNEKVHIKPDRTKPDSPILIIRHGYDCYKMRGWKVKPFTILDELEKWMSRLPVLDFHIEK